MPVLPRLVTCVAAVRLPHLDLPCRSLRFTVRLRLPCSSAVYYTAAPTPHYLTPHLVWILHWLRTHCSFLRLLITVTTAHNYTYVTAIRTDYTTVLDTVATPDPTHWVPTYTFGLVRFILHPLARCLGWIRLRTRSGFPYVTGCADSDLVAPVPGTQTRCAWYPVVTLHYATVAFSTRRATHVGYGYGHWFPLPAARLPLLVT